MEFKRIICILFLFCVLFSASAQRTYSYAQQEVVSKLIDFYQSADMDYYIEEANNNIEKSLHNASRQFISIDSSDYNIIRERQKALEEQLGNMQYDSTRDLSLNEDVKDNKKFDPEQELFNIFRGNVQTAIELFSTILENSTVQNNTEVSDFIKGHLSQLQNVQRG